MRKNWSFQKRLQKVSADTLHGIGLTHLSERPSNLKQNGTQEKTPFSGTVFHTLSHGVLRFVASVSFKNHWIEAPWLAVKEFQPVRRWFFELTLATKRITPCERAWKTVLENGVFSCVPFCLRSLGRLERCVTLNYSKAMRASVLLLKL